MPNPKYKPHISPENKEKKILSILGSLRENKQTLTKSIWQRVHAGIDLCVKHPRSTGLIGLVALGIAIVDINDSRRESREATVQVNRLEKKIDITNSQLAEIIINKSQLKFQLENEKELNKTLTQTISDLSNGQGVLGSKEQIDAAMSALAQGDTDKAKQLFSKAAQKGEQEALETDLQTAKAYRNLGALAFLDNTQQALKAYRQATELDPNNPNGWNQLGLLFQRVGKLDQAITAYNNVLTWGVNQQDKESISIAYGNLGNVYQTRGELDKAVEFYQKSLLIDEALGRKQGVAIQYGNLGLIYQTQGELDKAIEFHQKSLAIDEALGRKQGIANQYGNLGLVYQTRGELDKAIEFYQKSLAIDEALGRKRGMAICYSNLGTVYGTRGELDKAIEFHQKALAINETLGRKQGMASNYGNLGNVYQMRRELDKAIEFYQKALAIDLAIGRKEGMANQSGNLGGVYERQGNSAEAKRYWKMSLKLFKEIGSPTAKRVQSSLDELAEAKK